ncbi:hypothetical protein GA0070612_5756 [Micromonospora chokoriensis]|uniref:Uncharacterized protein n=1 Tax=Micromonospora chokoriensis TaxID=356851 RepID=A0A1C4Z593_9ACTN|nr:hypothetical protein GA0070612_5756 [Micromonospora chokoriensis]
MNLGLPRRASAELTGTALALGALIRYRLT